VRRLRLAMLVVITTMAVLGSRRLRRMRCLLGGLVLVVVVVVIVTMTVPFVAVAGWRWSLWRR
jgi:uncharacterized membrane protein YccC